MQTIGKFFKSPIGVILVTNFFWHILLLAFGIPFNYLVSGAILILDVALVIALRNLLIYFFAQFTLPVQNSKDRKELSTRVRNFEFDEPGPALFVKNGRVIKHKGEEDNHEPGVIVLDTASALVLRTDTEIRDTVGPGIKFTQADEYIAGSVDLRTQHHYIKINETDKHSQRHAQHTQGLTRDGFEISVTLSVKFRIKRPAENRPSESGVFSRYGYDPRAVQNAILRELVILNSDGKQTHMEWNRLPTHLVVNLWREYIRKFRLSDLFTTEAVSGLQTIEEMLNQRVKKPQVMAFNDTGQPTGEWVDSLEHRQLEARGMEILEVRIHDVQLDSAIETSLIEAWSSTWLKFAKEAEAKLKEEEALLETIARKEADRRFAILASEKISERPQDSKLTSFSALEFLLEPIRDFIVTESNDKNNLEKEAKQLDEIFKWLLENTSSSVSSSLRGKR
ncbi:MAG: hypothetical protein IT310_14555 [Anaerolineales bacterium]|nr:hypothetical protein [Anaerolineales bacterium]